MKITDSMINKGNTRANFQGQYINKFSNEPVNPNIGVLTGEAKKRIKLERNLVEEGIAKAENTSHRGFKKKIFNSNNKPLFWSKSDFTPFKAGGFTYENGAGRGGEFTTTKNKNYKPTFGVAGSGVINADKPSGEVNPFPVKSRKSVKKSNRK